MPGGGESLQGPLDERPEVHRLAAEPDLPARDSRDVEEVIDQGGQLSDLPRDDGPGGPGRVIGAPEPIQNGGRPRNRPQWVAQLVAQHREEFVFGRVQAIGFRPRLALPRQEVRAFVRLRRQQDRRLAECLARGAQLAHLGGRHGRRAAMSERDRGIPKLGDIVGEPPAQP